MPMANPSDGVVTSMTRGVKGDVVLVIALLNDGLGENAIRTASATARAATLRKL